MADIRITAGAIVLHARLERALAPETCRHFESLLPWSTRLIHVRWSGEACWVPLGEEKVPFGFENATSHPAPGHMLFYPGGYSETEVLLAYGSSCFASKMGQLAGNHFLTVTDGLEQLVTLGKRTLWEGAQELLIERV
jgi:hypothetical protein